MQVEGRPHRGVGEDHLFPKRLGVVRQHQEAQPGLLFLEKGEGALPQEQGSAATPSARARAARRSSRLRSSVVSPASRAASSKTSS